MLTAVLTNFNHGRYLSRSLGSILEQTRPPDEVIVIDDASTDDSIAIIDALLPGFPNARLVRNLVNQGVIANLNDGLRLARGEYVHFAAADDVFYRRLYEVGMRLPGTASRSSLVFCAKRPDRCGRPKPGPV